MARKKKSPAEDPAIPPAVQKGERKGSRHGPRNMISLPDDLYAELKAIARSNNRPISWEIRTWLWELVRQRREGPPRDTD